MTSYRINTKFTPDVIYCTAARQQFSFIHNTMFDSTFTIQLVPITFVKFVHTSVLTIVLPPNACHSTSKWVT